MLREDYGATQVSADAGVTVASVTQPARGSFIKRTRSAITPDFDPATPGIAVAIIDSGVQPHADLPLNRIRAFKDFVGDSRRPVDGCGHGDDNIVWGNDESASLVWGIDGADGRPEQPTVGGHSDDDNIVWGDGVLRSVWALDVVWGFWDDDLSWGNITRDTAATIWGNVQRK